MRMRSRPAVTLLVLAALIACSEATTPDGPGMMSFTFTGAGNGTFNASGDAPASTPNVTVSWTRGIVDGNAIYITASAPRDGGRIDGVMMRVDIGTTGSVPAVKDCGAPGTPTPCGQLAFIRNLDQSGISADFRCDLTSGIITIATITATRITGTFSGTGVCDPNYPNGPTEPFTLTGGSLHVPRVYSN